MRIRRLGLGVFAAMMGLLIAAPANADEPEIIREMNPFNFPIVDCDSFLVWTKGWERDTFKWWYDEFGEPVRLQWKIQVTESEYYNGMNPDNSISQGKNGVGENATINIDFTTGEEHNSGANFRLTIPGIGHVFLSVGTFFFIDGELIVHHGPEIVAETETGLALCEALE